MAADEQSGRAPSREASRRLFFALWPDESMRADLARATREMIRASGGRPVTPENLHVTLAFLGAVAESRLPQLEQIGRHVARTAASGNLQVALTLDRVEYWRAAGLLCARPTERCAAVDAVAQTLRELLTQGGFASDPKPFRAHVTLARRVARSARSSTLQPIGWECRQMALVASRTEATGATYRVLRAFPLGAAQAAQ